MSLNLQKPIIYLITSGATTKTSHPASVDFQSVLALIRAAVLSGIPLIQLREKNLTTRALYELTARAVEITRGSSTRILVNDRADVARSAGADGCHLTTRSLSPLVIRRALGPHFLIGVSAHTHTEAQIACEHGADFAVFGPVFDTPSKSAYGPAVGLEALSESARSLAPFPLIALGGITRENAREALKAGASGVAAIRLFSEPWKLAEIAAAIRER
jgi:thiamine-phosphate pyrophosphorylase